MARVIDVGEMTCFETAADGSGIRIDMEDTDGAPVSLSLPLDCLNRLIMTLPGMVTSAVQRRHSDPSLRIVYPVEQFQVELGGDLATRILTLGTPDGFRVSFGLSAAQYGAIGEATAFGPSIRSAREH